MKNLILLLITFVLSFNSGFSQDSQIYRGVKYTNTDDAVKALKSNYYFRYFKSPNDIVVNSVSFTDDLSRIVKINNKKTAKIRTLIISAVNNNPQRLEINDEFRSLSGIWIRQTDYIIFMGTNINNIIQDQFTPSEYQLIFQTIAQERLNANLAYLYLIGKYEDEGNFVSQSIFSYKELFDKIYQRYNI